MNQIRVREPFPQRIKERFTVWAGYTNGQGLAIDADRHNQHGQVVFFWRGDLEVFSIDVFDLYQVRRNF